MINIFVGNLDITVTEQQPQELFAPHGTVETITMVKDRDTGEPRGIALLEMTQATQAQNAISALDGTMLNGRPMNVNKLARSFIEVQFAIRSAEIIGDIGSDLLTSSRILDRFW